MVLFINNKEQAESITHEEAILAIREGLRQYAQGNAIRRPRIDNFVPTKNSRDYFCFSSMEGGIKNGYYALRIKPDIMDWPVIGDTRRKITYCSKPGTYGGLVFIFDINNAELLAIMNDGFVQHLRVAASAAVGVDYLARQDSEVMGVIGSGGMARSFVPAFCTVRDVNKVKVYSKNRHNVEQYAEEISRHAGKDVVVKDNAESVVRGSDIVCVCTNSTQPVINAAWVDDGAHIANVVWGEMGSDTYERVDAFGLLVRRKPIAVAELFDEGFALRSHALSYAAGSQEERSRIPNGRYSWDFSKARYVDCINWDTGEKYKRLSGEVTMLAGNSNGTVYCDAGASNGIQGIQFASIGGKIYENALIKGIGKQLPLEMFLQDIPT